MKRLLALVVAVAMVVGAYAVRQRIDDDDDNESGPAASGDANDLVVVCIPELRAACGEGTVENTATTIARLAAGDEVDVWLTFEPLPALVDVLRAQAGREALFDEVPVPVAATLLAAVASSECDWRCIAEGDARIGMPDPAGATGLLILGAATAALLGADAATNDFDAEYDRLIARFLEPREVLADPTLRILQAAAFVDVALDLDAVAGPKLATADPNRRRDLEVTYPAPVATAIAVLAPRPGIELRAREDHASTSLQADGWFEPGRVPDLRSGLPNPGVLAAVRERVR